MTQPGVAACTNTHVEMQHLYLHIHILAVMRKGHYNDAQVLHPMCLSPGRKEDHGTLPVCVHLRWKVIGIIGHEDTLSRPCFNGQCRVKLSKSNLSTSV